jgi:hypothetical protein
MPRPIERRELIARMKRLDWRGPEAGKRHAVMRKGDHTVPLPNPHGGDIDWSLTKGILQQAGISPEEWESLD